MRGRCDRGCSVAVVMNSDQCLCPARVSGERCSNLGNGLVYAGSARRFHLVPGASLLRSLRETERDARDKNDHLALLYFCGGLLDVAAVYSRLMML